MTSCQLVVVKVVKMTMFVRQAVLWWLVMSQESSNGAREHQEVASNGARNRESGVRGVRFWSDISVKVNVNITAFGYSASVRCENVMVNYEVAGNVTRWRPDRQQYRAHVACMSHSSDREYHAGQSWGQQGYTLEVLLGCGQSVEQPSWIRWLEFLCWVCDKCSKML